MKLTADSPGNQLKIGSIEVDSLTALLPFEKWELTSPLKFFKGSSQKYQNVIIEGVGDRLFQNLVFDRLKDTLSSKDMYKLSEKIEVNYLSLKKHKQIPLACHYVEWKTRAQLHAKYGIKENGNKVEQILGHLYRQENEEANTLLSSHNNANAGDNQGTTLLMGASYADNAKAVESLIQLGAKLDLKDSLGCTALMYAIFGGAPNTMKVLIKSGADTKTTTDVGTSPWLHVCSSPLRQRYLDLTK